MATKNRPTRSGPSSSSSSAGRRGPPRASTPREAGRGREAPPEPPSSGRANYLVPGVLGALLLGAVVWYVKMNSGVPAEPARGAEAGGEQAPAPPSRPTPPPPLPQVPPPPAEVPPQQPAQDYAVTPVHPEPTSPDPRHGHFTLAEATAGMPAGARLAADIETSMGTFTCELWPDRAPTNVANFVGLARGTRDFWDPVAGAWARRPFYDGSVFHRVIPDFMIQGGDILRSGRGDPGYEIPDENVANHDEPGLLCMANHGPNTGGAQFFIMEDPKPHLNGSYSVLGRCTPVDLVERIARVPRDPHDRPLAPVTITHVRVHR